MPYGRREVGNDNGMFFKFHDLISDLSKSHSSNLTVFVSTSLKSVSAVSTCVFKVLSLSSTFLSDVAFTGKLVCFACAQSKVPLPLTGSFTAG